MITISTKEELTKERVAFLLAAEKDEATIVVPTELFTTAADLFELTLQDMCNIKRSGSTELVEVSEPKQFNDKVYKITLIVKSPVTTDYGTDVRIGKVVTKVSGLQNLIEALVRRLSTPTGSLFWDLEYGYDVRALLNGEIDLNLLEAAEKIIENQFKLDERVDDAKCFIVFNYPTSTMYLYISVTTFKGETFKLIVSVSKSKVEILAPEMTEVLTEHREPTCSKPVSNSLPPSKDPNLVQPPKISIK